MNKETREQKILATAREQFSLYGYYGARMDTIASESKINKRIVYEFCHTKEDLYMMVLSDVSIRAHHAVDEWFSTLKSDSPDVLYASLIEVIDHQPSFVRLWSWERLATTIHGPRILEAGSSFFERLRKVIREMHPHITDEQFEATEALCHGYILTSAMYLKCEPETDVAESEPASRPAYRHLETAMQCQGALFQSIRQMLTAD